MTCTKATAFFISLFIFGAFSLSLKAGTGVYESYVVLDVDGSGDQFYSGGLSNPGSLPLFDVQAFGVVDMLNLSGGELKTFKNDGGDVTGAELNYRVYVDGSSPGSFTALNLPFGSDFAGGNQSWFENSIPDIDLLSGLSPGDYVLEVYWKAFTNEGDRFDNNGGTNYKATFTVCGISDVTATVTADETCAGFEDGVVSVSVAFSGSPVPIEGSLSFLPPGTWIPLTPTSNPFVFTIDNLPTGTFSVSVREASNTACVLS
ncbi:MAG: hypothetical protein HKO93_08210, partial [Flavobacteriales bacterium]|nr:hypothetical protein [Flavobacteriales bacterium]